jgi:hypothetical protein
MAFDSARSGTWSVWVADTDGSNLVQISHEGPAGNPHWSPDSQKVAFDTIELSGLVGVYTADIADRVSRKFKTSVSAHDKVLYFVRTSGDANIVMLALDQPGAMPQEVSGMPKISNEFQWTLWCATESTSPLKAAH